MKTLCNTALTLLFAFCLFAALEPRAYAYIDPGSGLLVYQTISALVAGTVFHFRRKIRRFFGGVR
ncbi:MAG: hypothetical protein NVSMB62_04680 [Acidobacteriaceae bacterium]